IQAVVFLCFISFLYATKVEAAWYKGWCPGPQMPTIMREQVRFTASNAGTSYKPCFRFHWMAFW
ncbi:hypothetical protein ACE6ED_29065, partial [Paenibacillus sp. CN-4]|uniref:hypothetical protein n=1 Tax=Paenibacillus nanchangensis TaxID=3348343 RepID=UPI00397CFC64